MKQNVIIRRYQKVDLEDVKNICIATASERARREEKHRQFTLYMYCLPYLERERALVAEVDGVVVGYVLYALDYALFIKHMQPYMSKIEAISQEYSLRMRHEHNIYARFQKDYPAHLHIDCLPGYTGLGIGSQLIETMADDLKDEVNGVMLGVSKTNQGAINFYKKHDFDILDEDNAGYVMGRQLKKTTEYGLDGCNDAIHK
ncbi:GNAT family N-acetyltransferase [Sharpea azabuensis]|uniref:GNAT family N-acetyltransferase n=1 Tax=Sharpea azabuensis TaxID=322505 RepID=UPI00156A0954|nr:GNAT family N-acetyltransferase [Sharpea azabuensis]